jgi:hypothetical protein
MTTAQRISDETARPTERLDVGWVFSISAPNGTTVAKSHSLIIVDISPDLL